MADALDLDLVQAEPVGDGPGHVDDDRGVLAGVAVALDERGGQRLDDVRLGAERVHAAVGRAGRGAGAAVGAGAIQPAGGGGQQALDAWCRSDGSATPAETVMKPACGMSARSSWAIRRSQQMRAPLDRRAGHEDGHLVGAGAPEDVRRAREPAQALGDGVQRGVAGGAGHGAR